MLSATLNLALRVAVPICSGNAGRGPATVTGSLSSTVTSITSPASYSRSGPGDDVIFMLFTNDGDSTSQPQT